MWGTFPQCWPVAASGDSKAYLNIYSLSHGDESPKGKSRTHEWTREADLTQQRETSEGLLKKRCLTRWAGLPGKDSAADPGKLWRQFLLWSSKFAFNSECMTCEQAMRKSMWCDGEWRMSHGKLQVQTKWIKERQNTTTPTWYGKAYLNEK